ncbi:MULTISPECIES: 50S ribosomal protein L9 [Treponema]|uniref:Large ribosomal subunit protein bL9 n=7 Tax=Treponema TaxID=157 RepID=RL9_TREPA|nr:MULTISPECIES: 50S ribosomal protein L9 [Treponema]B2S208.1 RecName: Full=Large ribosomal subunit protein bL9; AltName: Full=50S ribosomal protein L9 [Treponema pallidum subsp. pallidum SS14]O83099.1 RecName: Full=Large ribosomal subunit protein bL9; AltName: Full=50S ribosomal protein L9 [Treponema pallidum subsp. pallidum str. Nichols]AAC65055.1 ribosomal protein L9 (rplI) [Treponema pallidum subsp. pallidum str. Nichols]ACD70487.1 ribosomal protein L9 [Treponema pallidum subsp. pallidum SS
MKIILNQDVKILGEEGDVKEVAAGYFRNYLYPRNLAVPHNRFTVARFKQRQQDIEMRKSLKRQDAANLKARLEAQPVVIAMPAGTNGKLYGAVTSHTVAEQLACMGFEVERKRVEVPGLTLKCVGNYHVTIRLYEEICAVVPVTIKNQSEADSVSE